jgi:NAD(P)-dependent dehydrogenase (short-subunit alcohol dehydrogenase family)
MSFLGIEGRVVVVAGGAGGIGSEVVRELAKQGATLVIADTDLVAARNLQKSISNEGARAAAGHLDLCSEASVHTFFQESSAAYGEIYGLVNAVGIVGAGTALGCDISEYQRQIELNCYGAMRLARAFVECSRRSLTADEEVGDVVKASYVYISSVAADLAIPDRDPYCVSKAAGQIFHLNLANEVARYGINVNVILPGRTGTPAAIQRAGSSSEAARMMYATQRRQAMIPSRTIAKTCVFLLCPELLGFSGQKVVVAEGADTTYRPSYEALGRCQTAPDS